MADKRAGTGGNPRPAQAPWEVLAAELDLLGFEPQHTQAGRSSTWTAADSSVTVTVAEDTTDVIRFADHRPDHGDTPPWTVTIGGSPPAHVCLMVLYAAVNAHDAAAALRAATEALAPSPPPSFDSAPQSTPDS